MELISPFTMSTMERKSAPFLRFWLLGLVLCVADVHGLRRRFPRETLTTNQLLPEELYLTPYIESGRLQEARNLSRVHLEGSEDESYSGYLTVDKQHGSNIFFWFFPAKKTAPHSAPVALWLQGGPGGTSMFGLFVEHGPFTVDSQLHLVPRNLSWTDHINMLYVDNPVGTGFSFTGDDHGYSKNEDDVAANLYSALTQFFTLFDSYKSNDFFVTGESYAGKYVPAIGFKIHQENKKSSNKINLKGIAIGDGLVDPFNMLDYGSVLYNIGLIDALQRSQMDARVQEVLEHYRREDLVAAFHSWDTIVNGDKTPYATFYKNFTGFDNYFNFLYPVDPLDAVPFARFLNQPHVRRALHVGTRPFNDGGTVEQHLLGDIMNSSRPMVEALLDAHYETLIYNGQMDVIVAYVLTQRWLAAARWHGASDLERTPRRQWRVGQRLAGYVRQVDNLQEVMVRNAGHMLPSDQPQAAYHLINSFVYGRALV